MDLATLIGIGLGIFLLGASIFTQEGWIFFFNLPAFLIVGGGTIAATLVNFPLKDVLGVIKVARNAFQQKVMSIFDAIEFWSDIARTARQQGLLALEDKTQEIDDEFTRKGIQLMVDQVDQEILASILNTEVYYIQERHEIGQKIFKAMGAYAPAFGMVGTLIGLIQMLQSLNDPTQIGVGMATALVTTLYGAVFANLLFLPLAGKLETRSDQEMQNKQLVMLAIQSIQAGDNPRLLNEKLMTFIAPASREE